MATGNRHKVSVKASKIPISIPTEDRGHEVCCDPFLVLASITEGDRYHNDITGVFEKLYDASDAATFVLEYNGSDVPPLGVIVTFPNEEFISAFVIDWRQHLAANGTGCYKVRCDYDINGVTGSIYKGTYNLMPWSLTNAADTVRILSIYNDFSRKHQIDFSGSGFADTIRFPGFFGLTQPNFEINNLTSTGFVKRKVENEATKSYELEMSPTTICYTSRLVEEHLLHANEIYISDHNVTNHDYGFQDTPVILKMETSPELLYTTGSRLAAVKATFEDKVQTIESQYAGDLTSGTNASYELVGAGVTVALPILIHNSDNSFATSQFPPEYELEDTTFDIYVYGSLNQTLTIPSMVDSTINIS